MSKRILFFGNERLATGVTTTAPVLRALIEAGYEVTAVIANHEDPISRQKRDLEIGPVAQSHSIPVILPGHNIPLAEKVRRHEAEVAVLVAYGNLIPQEVIDLFPKGIINVHPSLLPQYRGSTPLESAILNGDKATGVSLMRLVAEMDAGPVFEQREISLSGNEDKQDMADQLSQIGAEMVVKNLPAILDDSLLPQPQSGEPTFCQQIEKDDGIIDFSKTAERLEREVRAFAGWPRSRAKIGDINVIITKSHVADGTGQPGAIWREGKEFGFYTSDGVLVVDQLIPAGKKEMPAAAFLAGYKLTD